MTRARGLLAAMIALASVAGSRASRADAFSVMGLGPAGVASVGARAARAEDGTAAFYDPGGLALGARDGVELTPTLGVSALHAQGATVALESPFGFALALDATIPFQGALKGRVRFGFAGYFLPTEALRLVARAPEAPQFPYFDNRTQRLVVMPALGVKLARWLGVGVAANLLGGVGGPADLRPGASTALESRIDVEAKTQLAVNVGVRVDPSSRVHLAAVYRQRFALPATVTTTADVAGVPLTVDVATKAALFDPHTFVVAAGFDLGRASLELDASYAMWSEYPGPYLGVHAVLPGANLVSDDPPKLARDVVSVRASGETRLRAFGVSELALRAGAGFEPTMLKSFQQGPTNVVDADKVLAGLGATLILRDILPRTTRVGLGASSTFLTGYAQDKRVCTKTPCGADTVAGPDGSNPSAGVTNPGYPRLTGGGAFVSLALGVGVDL